MRQTLGTPGYSSYSLCDAEQRAQRTHVIASVAILDGDLFQIPVTEFNEMIVAETLLDGKTLWLSGADDGQRKERR